MAIGDTDRAMIQADAMRAAQVAIERAGLAEHWNNLSLIIGHTRTALAAAEQRIVDLEASDVESMNLYRNCRDRLEAKIVDLEQQLATAIPEDMAMRNQELCIKLATAERERDEARQKLTTARNALSLAQQRIGDLEYNLDMHQEYIERERDEARKDSRRIDFLEQVMRVVMPSGRHWIDYDYSGDLRSALDDSMEKLT